MIETVQKNEFSSIKRAELAKIAKWLLLWHSFNKLCNGSRSMDNQFFFWFIVITKVLLGRNKSAS